MGAIKSERVISRIVRETGTSPYLVRNVLLSFAESICAEVGEGEWVKTPLGVFRGHRRHEKESHLEYFPSQGKTGKIKTTDMIIMRLKPGSRLKKKPSKILSEGKAGIGPDVDPIK